jgi:hypothetical protein
MSSKAGCPCVDRRRVPRENLLVMGRDLTPSLALNCFADKLRAHFQWTDDDTDQLGGLATSYRAAGAWRLTQRIALHARASANIMHFRLRRLCDQLRGAARCSSREVSRACFRSDRSSDRSDDPPSGPAPGRSGMARCKPVRLRRPVRMPAARSQVHESHRLRAPHGLAVTRAARWEWKIPCWPRPSQTWTRSCRCPPSVDCR